MTTWWWVRHGPTHAKTFVGTTDLPADLSDKPALQRLDAFLPDTALIISSDLIRAARTADAIAGQRQRLDHDSALREMDFGDWEAKTFTEVSQSHPELSREFWSDPGDVAAPNGESWNRTARRVNVFVDRINRQYPDQHIIAVAHFGVILTQLQRAAKMTASSAMTFKIDNLSVTRLEFDAPHWRVQSVNQIP